MKIIVVFPIIAFSAAAAFVSPALSQPYNLSDRIGVLQDELATQKAVKDWPTLGWGESGPGVVFLKPSECDRLGGDVDYHKWCSPNRLKCVIGTRAVCIDEMDTGEE